ncbi:MAG: Asp23/Gls24 family envelope stress response protein [Clostridia bacterium]|nr:Asp23/Gls24 family envelope stress response protein [Candidatus Limimonas egerieequi]MCQ2489950.1 Asp23/Gls24 family envelope stress response protein [Clostridia bacterium]
MVNYENALGKIEISEEYFSQLLGSVVPTCFGVAGMANTGFSQQVRSFLHKTKYYLDRGVNVVREDDGLVVELHIIVTYGVNISVVVESIVNKVRYTIEDATGLTVKTVNVFVDSMIS